MRSMSASDFGGAICIETGLTETFAEVWEIPSADGLFSYLPRAINDCPDGVGSLGSGSDGVPRTGPVCP